MSGYLDQTYPPVAAPPRQRPPWSALDILLALVTGVALAAILLFGTAFVLQLAGVDTGTLSVAAQLLLVSVLGYGSLGLTVWYFALKRHHAPWSAIGFRPVGIGTVLLMVPVYIGLSIINLIVVGLVTLVAGSFNNPQNEALAPGGVLTLDNLILLLIAAAVIAPVVEELIFRGMVYQYMRTRMGLVVAVLLSAALFALVHFIPILIPILFTTGIVLALVMERYDSIIPAIILHAFNNGISLILLYLGLQTLT